MSEEIFRQILKRGKRKNEINEETDQESEYDEARKRRQPAGYDNTQKSSKKYIFLR